MSRISSSSLDLFNILPGLQEYLPGYKRKPWELTSNNATKLWLPPHPLATNDHQECSHNTTWTLPHRRVRPFPRYQILLLGNERIILYKITSATSGLDILHNET